MARAFVVCALPWLWASAALAQDAPVPAQTDALELEWQGEASCSDTGEVRAGALELLGGAPVRRRLSARATVQRDSSGWHVRIDTDRDGEHGTRELRGESCSAVQRAVSLMLAMILESEPPAPATVAPPEPEAPTPPPPAPPPVADTVPAAPAPPPAGTTGVTPRWLLGPELSTGAGETPHTGVAIGARVGVALGRYELGLAGRHWLAREQLAPLADAARPGHRVDRQELEAYGCFAPLQSRAPELEFSACIAPGLTRVTAEAIRVSGGPARISRWSPSLSGGVRLRYYPLTSVFAGLAPTLGWSRSQAFGIEVSRSGTDGIPDEANPPVYVPVYTTPEIFFRISFELGLRF